MVKGAQPPRTTGSPNLTNDANQGRVLKGRRNPPSAPIIPEPPHRPREERGDSLRGFALARILNPPDAQRP
ncbi:hypothetical protein GCM10023213_47050 [Prosthecobacter algae]|uniref:Uncharacterized protein n=1 Tax=Prosthecobacter algae TaxID=1144682 RepID=A0ABP9PN91_9BACT